MTAAAVPATSQRFVDRALPPLARRALIAASVASLGVWLGQAVRFPHAHWVVITAITLMVPGADGTLGKTFLRVVGTSLCAVLVIALYSVADPQPNWIIIACLVLIWAGYFLATDAAARYAILLWVAFGACFGLLALDDPARAPELVGARVFHITVGAILVFVGSWALRLRDPRGPGLTTTALPERIDRALRVTVAAALCIPVAALIERPDFAGTMIITVCVLGIRVTERESRLFGLLRLGGALSGGLLALAYYIFLLDHATSIGTLLAVIFVVVWFCSLLTASTNFSYLGMQTGLVFAFSVADSFAPSADIWIPLDRTAQVGLGTILFLLVRHLDVSRWVTRRPVPTG